MNNFYRQTVTSNILFVFIFNLTIRTTAVALQRRIASIIYISVNSVTFILGDFNIYLQLAFQFVINPRRISPMSLYSSNFGEFRNLFYLDIWKIYICNYRNFEVPTGDSVIYLLSYVSQLTQFILTLTDYLLFIYIYFLFLFCFVFVMDTKAWGLWAYDVMYVLSYVNHITQFSITFAHTLKMYRQSVVFGLLYCKIYQSLRPYTQRSV